MPTTLSCIYPDRIRLLFEAIADYNWDGKLDMALGLGYGTVGILNIWFGNGDGTFQPPVLYCPPGVVGGQAGGIVVAADFNGDGKPDIALQGVGSNPAMIILTNTTGAIVAPTLGISAISFSPSSVTGGNSSTGTVTLTSAAEVSTVVAITPSSSAISAPASVTVPAEAASTRFTAHYAVGDDNDFGKGHGVSKRDDAVGAIDGHSGFDRLGFGVDHPGRV